MKFAIRFDLEWLGGCLWADNDLAIERFDVGPIEDKLPLSKETLRRLEELSTWHDTALNWKYPPDPGPWRQDECDRFNAQVRDLVEAIQRELGTEFAVINGQTEYREDPDLDEYLRDPKGFRRKEPEA